MTGFSDYFGKSQILWLRPNKNDEYHDGCPYFLPPGLFKL